MKDPQNSKLHIFLLLGALVLAFSFRLIRLGAMPLFDSEAEIALEALSITMGNPTRVGPFPAIVGLTAVDFFIFESGNFLARFWAAAISGLIVIVPFLFRERLGLWGATAAAYILAISPELVGPSRLIGTPLLSAVCLLLSLGFLFQRKPILAGIFTSLGLMSGPGFWFGALILGVSYLIAGWLFDVAPALRPAIIERKKLFWLRFGLSSGVVLVVVGTGFFLAPQNLSGVFAGLVQFFSGIFQPSAFSVGLRFLALIAYALSAIVFGLWGGIRGAILRNKVDLFLLVWGAVALLCYVFYPAGQPSYLMWVSLPLWLLAVRAFFFVWHAPRNSRLVVIGVALLVIVVSAFMLLALRTLVRPDLLENQQTNTFIALIGGMGLLVAIILLIYYGWAEEIASAGLLLGVLVVVLAGLISGSVNTTSLNPENSQELWLPKDQPISTEYLNLTIDRVLYWNKRENAPVEIVIADFDTPAMAWALHGYETVDFVPYLAPQSRPGILITDFLAIPEISSSYRGQDLVWSRETLWHEMAPIQHLTWLLTRDAPQLEHKIILWVRTDLMPDEQFTP